MLANLTSTSCLAPMPWWACSLLIISSINTSGASSQFHSKSWAANHEQVENSLLFAPSPRDYVALNERACDLNAKRPRATRAQLIQFYSQNSTNSTPGSGRLLALIESGAYKLERECRREPAAWRFKYVDEGPSGVLVREDSIDERLSNVVYTTRTDKGYACDSYVYDSGNSQRDALNRELVAGPEVNDELCGAQLNRMVELIHELERKLERARQSELEGHKFVEPLSDLHISLAKVLDTFGRYESGFLSGRLLAVGFHEQCQESRLILDQTNRTRMRFCWANLSLRNQLAPSLQSRPRHPFDTPVHFLSAGICIPRSCHSKSFHKHRALFNSLTGSQFKLPQTIYLNQTLPLDSVYCEPDAGSRFQMPLAGKLLLGALAAWLLLAILVTYKNRTYAYTKDQMIRANRSPLDTLDLYESWKDFMRARDARDYSARAQLVDVNTMNVIKAIACFAVVLAHSLIMFLAMGQSELTIMHLYESNAFVCGFQVCTVIVDTFIVISALLMTYFTLKHLNRKRHAVQLEVELAQQIVQVAPDRTEQRQSFIELQQTSDRDTRSKSSIVHSLAFWLKLSAFRWLRIVPLFALIHWFKKYVFIYAGSGPLWDHGFNWRTPSGACRNEPAWIPLTFISAYLPITHQCINQSWSVSNDLFFALFAPPIIMLIHTRPRSALAISLITCALSYLSVRAAIAQVPVHLDEELRELRSYSLWRFFDQLSLLYTAPHYRIYCYIIGVWAGYYLHKYQQEVSLEGNLATIVWPRWMCGIGTKLSLIQIVVPPLIAANRGPVIALIDPYHRLIWPEIYSSARVLWSLSNAILLLRLVTDWKDSALGRFSASKFWQVFSKLNYAILLLHVDLLLFTIGSAPAPPTHTTMWAFFNLASSTMLLCVFLGIFVFVVYENTMDKLTRALLPEN